MLKLTFEANDSSCDTDTSTVGSETLLLEPRVARSFFSRSLIAGGVRFAAGSWVPAILARLGVSSSTSSYLGGVCISRLPTLSVCLGSPTMRRLRLFDLAESSPSPALSPSGSLGGTWELR